MQREERPTTALSAEVVGNAIGVERTERVGRIDPHLTDGVDRVAVLVAAHRGGGLRRFERQEGATTAGAAELVGNAFGAERTERVGRIDPHLTDGVDRVSVEVFLHGG